jgi:hypothetical protein
MTTNRTWSGFAWATMALPVILGAPLCYLRPDGAWAWMAGMFIVPVACFIIKALRDRLPRVGTVVFPKAIPAGAIIFSSLLLSVSLGAPLAAALGLIDNSLAHVIGSRGVYALGGCYFIVRGNRLPKMLSPLSATLCDPATMQALQRRTGWAYVLAGLAIAIVWVALPLHLAQPIGMAIIALGILVPTFIMRAHANRRDELQNH